MLCFHAHHKLSVAHSYAYQKRVVISVKNTRLYEKYNEQKREYYPISH